jgi:uncharacterized protein DUF4124
LYRPENGDAVPDRNLLRRKRIQPATRFHENIMRMPVLLLVAVAPFASTTAAADVYKWVDKNGRTHYSDQIPAKGARVLAVTDRLSLYSPEPAVAQALQASAGRTPPAALADRGAMLERQLQAERLARQSAAADARAAAYERCLADRRTDCDQILSGAAPAS